MDYRHRLIVAKLREGYTSREAAAAAGIHRQSLWRWLHDSAEFADAVAEARETGKTERTYRLWVRHPFRGKCPPTGKGRGGRPKFTYGRR
jgi:hypothetical protein